jgi:hypothetical protein
MAAQTARLKVQRTAARPPFPNRSVI